MAVWRGFLNSSGRHHGIRKINRQPSTLPCSWCHFGWVSCKQSTPLYMQALGCLSTEGPSSSSVLWPHRASPWLTTASLKAQQLSHPPLPRTCVTKLSKLPRQRQPGLKPNWAPKPRINRTQSSAPKFHEKKLNLETKCVFLKIKQATFWTTS